MNFNTSLLHSNFSGEKSTGATLTPIYQVSAFAQESAEQLEKVFNNKAPGFAYTRISNPTVASFENRVNALEKGIGAVACSSGMAAVTMSLLNILQSGDEIIGFLDDKIEKNTIIIKDYKVIGDLNTSINNTVDNKDFLHK